MICPPTTRSVTANRRTASTAPPVGLSQEVVKRHLRPSRSNRALHAQHEHPEGQSLVVGPFDPSPNEAPLTIRGVSTWPCRSTGQIDCRRGSLASALLSRHSSPDIN